MAPLFDVYDNCLEFDKCMKKIASNGYAEAASRWNPYTNESGCGKTFPIY